MPTFPAFQAKHTPPVDCTPVPQSAIDQNKGKLPDDLLAFWSEHGWCGWGNGLIWTVNPADFEGALSDWMKDTSGKSVILRTAFGSMFVWDGSETQFIDVITRDVSPLHGGMAILLDGVLADDGYLDHVVRKKIFDEAFQRVGRPNPDEVYGFVPAVALGGPGTSDTVQRMKLKEHLHLLSQLG